MLTLQQTRKQNIICWCTTKVENVLLYLISQFIVVVFLSREVYEFPLTQSDMAQQTLNLHICRYDSFSRRTSIGDVFLALAELSAQGIDFTREVFLCRNVISHQEVAVCYCSSLLLYQLLCRYLYTAKTKLLRLNFVVNTM